MVKTVLKQADVLEQYDLNTIWFIVTGLGILLWIIANLTMATGWIYISRMIGCNLSSKNGYKIFLKTQIAKYVPFNVMQIATRVIMGNKAGVSNKAGTAATVLEAILFCAAGIAFGVPLFLVKTIGILSVILIPVLTLVAALLLSWKFTFLNRWAKFEHKQGWAFTYQIIRILFVYELFFIIGGTLTYFLIQSMSAGESISYLQIVSTSTLAWIGGFIIFVAPGGLGVREAIFIWLIPDSSLQALVAVSILSLRLVTVLGDVAAYLVSIPISFKPTTLNTPTSSDS